MTLHSFFGISANIKATPGRMQNQAKKIENCGIDLSF